MYKIFVALCFVIGYIFYRIFYIKFDNSDCLVDTYFEATWNANRWMNDTAGKAILGIMQVMMDSWIIFAGLAWYLFRYKKADSIKKHAFPSSGWNNLSVQGNFSGIINYYLEYIKITFR